MGAIELAAPNARVLVINVARIGDTLLMTPALRALKRAMPLGRLGALAHPGRRELLINLPFLDSLGAITPRRAWWQGRLAAERWDIALVYGHDTPLIEFAARVAARVVAFEQRDAAANARLWRAVPAPTSMMHAVPERLMLPAALGIETTDLRLAYAPLPHELAAAKAWLASRTELLQTPIVGFQIASFATKTYRDWPLENFIELGRRLFARRPRARIVVFGGNESRAPAQRLAREFGARVIPVAGTLTLRQSAALMTQLQLYVGVDTGPTHLAGALRVPMVALYHCRHRGRYLAPLQHDRLRVLEHPASDAECGEARSMADIGVDQVWNAAESLLD